MAYTAIAQMRAQNYKKFGIDAPVDPALIDTLRIWEKDANGRRKTQATIMPVSDPRNFLGELEVAVMKFIREDCEGLRFKREEPYLSLKDREGASLKPGQIPYNMQMDIDRRCLETAVHRFLESGTAEDAFDVYFCYIELFIGSYGQSKKIIEMLSNFESNASALLMKHRDHYSHSVYLFLMGLAIYESSPAFKKAYKDKYSKYIAASGSDPADEKNCAAHFLEYWGLTALFHDIGYPFELSFEQVNSYFDGQSGETPFVKFELGDFIKVEEKDEELLHLLLPEYEKDFGDFNNFFAQSLDTLLKGKYEESKGFLKFREKQPGAVYTDYLRDAFERKATKPETFGKFMDHAYFSAIILVKKLIAGIPKEKLNPMYAESCCAIILHNSLYKFTITNYKDNGEKGCNRGRHFPVSLSPLAYLLMLCDEIQVWDRTLYGQNSRREIHATNCRLSFSENRIQADYYFDDFYEDDKVAGQLAAEFGSRKGTYKKLINGEFLEDIESIVSINSNESFGEASELELSVSCGFTRSMRFRKTMLSSSSYIHLYEFAVMVHGMNHLDIESEDYIPPEEREALFNEMSLEYKLSHIGRAKKFARYLHEIHCFYSDKPADYEPVDKFSDEELEVFMGPLEHDRWCWDHILMGWTPGDEYTKVKDEKNIRELTRVHKDMPPVVKGYTKEIGISHFAGLKNQTREKDTRAMNNLLHALNSNDGIKVYKLIF